MGKDAQWFVVQTCAGTEEAVCAFVEQAADEELVRECFVPRFRTARRVRGQWQPCTEVLFPGYLIVVTACPRQLQRKLRQAPRFSRLLESDGQFIPLNDDERAWIEAFTQRDHRVIEMSEGYLEGDEVVITSGPLMNRTAWIRKVNHRKKRAYLELDMFGHTIQAQVGLRIVRKRT